MTLLDQQFKDIEAAQAFRTMRGYCIASTALTIILAMMLWAAGAAHSAEIPRDRAINAIIGEAENQGTEGMSALAHAIRNRAKAQKDLFKGVYGEHAPRVKARKYSPKTFMQAVKAWEESAHTPDPTHGATGWGNAKDLQIFKRAKWFKKAIITAKIKDHFFYKLSR